MPTKPRRVNFLALALLMLAVGAMQAVNRNWGLAGALAAAAVLLLVMHFIRVRRFKRFDDTQTFN